MPGALTPKFPQIIAAASMARAEVLSYFRHLNLESRSDTKKHVKVENFKTSASDMPQLLKELVDLSAKVRNGKEMIIRYYVEWLNRLDAKALADLHQELGPSASDSMKELLNSIVVDLKVLRADDFLNSSEGVLSRLRFRAQQIQAYLLQKSREDRSDPVPPVLSLKIIKRMRAVLKRTYYVDSLSSVILRHSFLPIELWYFQEYVQDCFLRTTKEFTVESCATIAFFVFVSSALENVHPDCPEEAQTISTKSVAVCNQLCLELGNHITSVLQLLEAELEKLHSQLYPVEAAYRAERSLIAKKSGTVYVEPLPGSESKSWARKSIIDLIYIRSILVGFIQYAKKFNSFTVYSRSYSIKNLVRQQIETYVESRLTNLFGTEENFNLATISAGVNSYHTICQTGQIAYGVFNLDFPMFLRKTLYNFFCPTSLPPPGAPIPSVISVDHAHVWTLGKCFVKFIENMTVRQSSVLWVRPLRMFTAKHQYPHSKDDLKHMCSIIGPQGVRAIGFEICSLITEYAQDVKEFLEVNKSTLLELRRDYCTSIGASFKLQNLEEFTQTLVGIGVALAMRERLSLSLRDSHELWIPSTLSSLQAMIGGIDTWAQISQQNTTTDTLYQLAADMGIEELTKEKDITLQNLLRSSIMTDENDDMILFELLPVACASTFLSTRWDTVHFEVDKEVFEGNEHTICLAIPKLITSLVGIAVGEGREDVSVGESTVLSSLKEAAELFVAMSAHFIAVMRVQESEPMFRVKPLRAMSTVLEASVLEFPHRILTRATLEKHLPYSMIHSDNMDISLGKLRFGDKMDLALFDADDAIVVP